MGMTDSGNNSSPPDGFWPLDRSAFGIRRRMHYPSTRETINDAVALILDVARQCGCDADQEADLEIALREALANAVIHGNDEDQEKNVFVRCYGGHAMTLVLVRDEGPGFEPAEIPDPRNNDRLQLDHGRGLFLMKALMDEVQFNDRGNSVTLVLRFEGEATA